jgi:hypothetical protein
MAAGLGSFLFLRVNQIFELVACFYLRLHGWRTARSGKLGRNFTGMGREHKTEMVQISMRFDHRLDLSART